MPLDWFVFFAKYTYSSFPQGCQTANLAKTDLQFSIAILRMCVITTIPMQTVNQSTCLPQHICSRNDYGCIQFSEVARDSVQRAIPECLQ